jgi:hypothetical protein
LRFAVSRYRASALYSDLPPGYSKLLQKAATEMPIEKKA